jgi:hypothetical protein
MGARSANFDLSRETIPRIRTWSGWVSAHSKAGCREAHIAKLFAPHLHLLATTLNFCPQIKQVTMHLVTMGVDAQSTSTIRFAGSRKALDLR